MFTHHPYNICFWQFFLTRILFFSINHTKDFCIEKMAPELPDLEEFFVLKLPNMANSSCRWSPIVATSQKIERKKNFASILHVGCWLTLAITQELQFFFPLTGEISPKTKQKLNYIAICVWMNPRMQPTFWSFLSEWIYECKKVTLWFVFEWIHECKLHWDDSWIYKFKSTLWNPCVYSKYFHCEYLCLNLMEIWNHRADKTKHKWVVTNVM